MTAGLTGVGNDPLNRDLVDAVGLEECILFLHGRFPLFYVRLSCGLQIAARQRNALLMGNSIKLVRQKG